MSRGAGNGLGALQSLSRAYSTPMPRPTPLRGPCGPLSATEPLRVRVAGVPKVQPACPGKQEKRLERLFSQVKGERLRVGAQRHP
jgi:hypothetical protein